LQGSVASRYLNIKRGVCISILITTALRTIQRKGSEFPTGRFS
jgi:hypothetical protein